MLQTFVKNLAANVAANTTTAFFLLPAPCYLMWISWSAWWNANADADNFIAQLYLGQVTAVDQSTSDLNNLLGELRGVLKVGAAFGNQLHSFSKDQACGGIYVPQNQRITLALQSGTASVTARVVLTFQGEV